MHYKKELKYKELLLDFDFLPEFGNTNEIKSYKDIIGQERAVEAIEFGLSMDRKGYNIFVSGSMGTGKRTYILEKLKKHSKKLPAPFDWCYVYNFKNPYKPIAICLNSGDACKFEKDIKNVLKLLYTEVPKKFTDNLYERERNSIIDLYKKMISKAVDSLQKEAQKSGFKVKSTSESFAFIPVINGAEITEKEYDNLEESKKEEINLKVSELKLAALDVIKKTKEYKKEMTNEIKKLDSKVSLSIIEDSIIDIKKLYGYSDLVLEYIKDLQEDVIKNIDVFIDFDDEKDSDSFDEDFFRRYMVNVFMSSTGEGVPVIYENQPDYSNLIGAIEYESSQGSLVTDFTMIKPGSLHRANGGYIVIEAEAILRSYGGWAALKKCLRSEKVAIENIQSLKSQYDITSLTSIEPDEIPLNVKVILLGNPYLYYLLYSDEYFREFFKVKADFDEEIKNSTSSSLKILGFISNYCRENDLPPITRDGVKEILMYSCREMESRIYYTAKMDKIVNIIEESSVLVKQRDEREIDKKDVKEAVKKLQRRFNIYKEKTIDKYVQGKYIVDVKGFKAGEINALSVIDTGDFKFGKQNKITVTTYASRTGIVNIEREASISGNIHNKGVLILTGYFNETFGKNKPISFGASICFEQLYGGVDGDSASLAELVTLISSLSETAINQGIAVTGSVNQKGMVQPVGGVSKKIEGFFEVCKVFGLTGEQGVILPRRNIDDIVLSDNVLEAVKKGLFHIYPVETVDECFNIITSKELSDVSRGKVYQGIKEKVMKRLDSYNEVLEGNN